MEKSLWVGGFGMEPCVQHSSLPEPAALVDLQVQEGGGLL